MSTVAGHRFSTSQCILRHLHHLHHHLHLWVARLARNRITKHTRTSHSCTLHWIAQAIVMVVKGRQVCSSCSSVANGREATFQDQYSKPEICSPNECE